MPGDLLEAITSRLGKSSISDLRFVSVDELLAGIKNMSLTEYDLKEWSYVIAYIFDKTVELNSYESIVTSIKKVNE